MFFTINSGGDLKVTQDAVSASSFYNGGFAYLADGSLHVSIAGASLTDVFIIGGLAVTSQGALYVTSDAPADSAVLNGGVLCRADGAVHVGSSGGYFAGGMPVDALGRLYASIAASSLAVLDSDGNSFSASLDVLDSDGNSFSVTNAVLDSDGNSFSVI